MISLVVTAGITSVLVIVTGQSVEDVVSLFHLYFFLLQFFFKTSQDV
jgi:hypothetical protein